MNDTIHHVDCEKKTFFAAALILRSFVYCAFTRDHEAMGLHLCLKFTCKSTINKAAQDQRSCKESPTLTINVVNRVGHLCFIKPFIRTTYKCKPIM